VWDKTGDSYTSNLLLAVSCANAPKTLEISCADKHMSDKWRFVLNEHDGVTIE
jgi:hypothetical protein